MKHTLARTLIAASLAFAGTTGAVAVAAPATASTAEFGTLAQRNAYISCVAPGTEVSPTLRIKLLNYAMKALEGIRANVPAATVTASLRRIYGLSSTEASKVYWCTKKVWG